MFYYPSVLKRHSGCFSTIWLVATKGIKVPRREFLKVDVGNTCDGILDYVLQRVPPPRPDLPRPRFSLYLSSQLQYGVIVVYHRQCVLLLEEIQFIVTKLMKKRTSQRIDMDASRLPVVLPDALAAMEEAEEAPDPLFGVMYMQETVPSPSALIQVSWEYLRDSTPDRPEVRSPAAAAADAAEDGITASQESITMRETEPVAFPAPEFKDEELGDQQQILDLLLEQSDEFPEGELEAPEEQERELGREEREKKDRTKTPTGSTIELPPATVSGEELMLPEQLDVPAERPEPPSGLLTPVHEPGFPSPPPTGGRRKKRRLRVEHKVPGKDPLTPEVKPTRRRQLIFLDPETQLSEEALRQQINNPLVETKRPVFPFSLRIPAAALFNSPCCSFLPEEIQFLWRQAAIITPVSGSDLQVGERGPESTDSEREREREKMEEAEKEQERGSEEAPSEAAEEKMFDDSAQGTLPLESSDQREVSREISPVYSFEREGSSVSRSVSALQDIPEVEVESSRFLPEHEEAPVLFHSLLPPGVDRRTVSNAFHRLLEDLSERKVRAEQDEPYGDIWISPHSNYRVMHML